MEIDVMLIGLLAFGGVIFAILAFVVAKYQDIVWRAKTFRRMFKRNIVILERVSKDGKTRVSRLIDLNGDMFHVGRYTWVVKNSRIYRKDNESMGFKAKQTNMAWQEGVPILTVDEDTIKPLDFYKEDATIRPEELGSTLSAWVMNQLAKGFAMIKNQDLWLKIIAVGVVINLFLSYTTMDAVGRLEKKIEAPAPAQGSVSVTGGTATQANGTIKITQGGT